MDKDEGTQDPRSLVPLRVHDSFRDFEVSAQEIEEVILDTSGLRATYIFSNFDGILVTRRIPSAAVMVNRRTRRLAVLVNPDFVKKLVLFSVSEKEHRNNRAVPRSQDFMRFVTDLADEEGIEDVKRRVIQALITHEFSHVWFHHLQRESPHSTFLTNLVHDSLLNYHMNLDLGLGLCDKAGSEGLFVDSITFIKWVEESVGRWGHFEDFRSLVTEGYREEMSNAQYVGIRCFEAMKCWAKEGMTDKVLARRVWDYCQAVKNYSEGVAPLIDRLMELFPKLEGASGCSMHPLPAGHTPKHREDEDAWDEEDGEEEEQLPLDVEGGIGIPIIARPGAGAGTGAGEDDGEDDEEAGEGEEDDSCDEDDRPSVDLSQVKRTYEDQDYTFDSSDPERGLYVDKVSDADGLEGPKDSEPTVFLQIDPHTDKLSLDGTEYIPLGDHDIPPDFDSHLEKVLESTGMTKEFTEAIITEVEDKKLDRETIKAVLKSATKSLLRQARRALDLDPRPNPGCTTVVPNRYPIVSDMILHNNLLLDREPRYKVVATQEEDIRQRKVAIFIDISGSMQGVWPQILAFVLALSKECELDIYQFSTDVVPMTLAEVKAGTIHTRYGTDANPVIEKIVELSRVADSFVVFGDREYSGSHKVPRVAQPIKLLDVGYDQSADIGTPWFHTTDKCMVHYVDLAKDFKVLREGAVCDKNTLNERRKAQRRTLFGRR